MLAENNICDKMCGRCQTSLPGEDSDDSSDQESDEVRRVAHPSIIQVVPEEAGARP